MKEGRCGQKHSGGQSPVRVAGRCEISGVVHNDVPTTPQPFCEQGFSEPLVRITQSDSWAIEAEDVLVLERQQTLLLGRRRIFVVEWLGDDNDDQLEDFCLLDYYLS